MYIVIFRQHGQLNLETQHIGPFASFDEAYAYLCELPALGICPVDQQKGVKCVFELQPPDLLK